MRETLWTIFAATLEKWSGTLLECNGEPDHMHLLVELPPTVQLSTCVNSLKTVSSATASAEGASERPSSRLLRKSLWARVGPVV
jgi:putative transposase